MATANQYDLHDHAGARWLAPFAAVIALTVLVMLAMLIYPHLLVQ